ncbi:unnamed protein product [Brassica rapa subsp. trilocularis]
MSLFLSRFSRKHELAKHLQPKTLLYCQDYTILGFSTSLRQTPPCFIIGAKFVNHTKVSAELVYNDCFDTIVTIRASHG